MDLAAFTEKTAQLRTLIEQARDVETKAYEEMKGLQQEMVRAITAEDIAKLDLLEGRYNEVEEHWRNCSLYTAELRAEMHDLIKERHGERPQSASGDIHAAPLRIAAQSAGSSSRGMVHSLDRVKAVRITADDVSPTRRNMVRAAYPDLDPRYTQPETNRLPIGDAGIRTEFERLLNKETNEGFASEGCVKLATCVRYFASQETMGVPIDAERWVARSLSKYDADIRRIVSRGGSQPAIDLEGTMIDFPRFAYLMVRWAQH